MYPSGSQSQPQINDYSYLAYSQFPSTLPQNIYQTTQPVMDAGVHFRSNVSQYSCGSTRYVDHSMTQGSFRTLNSVGTYENRPMGLLPSTNHHSVQSITFDPQTQQPSILMTQFPASSSRVPRPETEMHSRSPHKLQGVTATHAQGVSGRRKSETTTSQARRRSSACNPYSRSKPDGSPSKESHAAEACKEVRTYRSANVLTNELGPVGPTNHVLVPQDNIFGEPTSYGRHTDYLFAPIEFRTKGFHELGVMLKQILKQHSDPIEHSEDKVFERVGYREIKVKIQWPGYPHFPFEKRVKTHNGTMTRNTLLYLICNMIIEYVMTLKDRKAVVEKGYETWQIGNGGLKANTFFVTGLLHRGGNYFQPEIWVPRPK